MIEIQQARQNRRVILKIKNINKQMDKGIRRGFYLLGVRLQKEAKKAILKRPRSGTEYVITTARRRRRHRASQPGEAPASISGRLWRSLDFKVSGARNMKFGYDTTAKSRDGFEYGRYWEAEAPQSERRPALLNSIEKNQGFAIRMFNREIKKALK